MVDAPGPEARLRDLEAAALAFEQVGRSMHGAFAATIEDGPTLLGKIQAALNALRG